MRTNEEKYEAICNFLDNVKINKITVLTGDNASGKSLIRKLLWQSVCEQTNDDRKPAQAIVDMSMERRTGSYASLGALSGIFRDDSWVATSVASIRFIENITHYTEEKQINKRYLVFDEPEVGCGEEVQLGIANFINSKKEYFEKYTLGVLIITHSKHIVKNIECDEFFNLEGKTKEEWLNREIVAKDPIELEKEADSFFIFLRDKLTSAKA